MIVIKIKGIKISLDIGFLAVIVILMLGGGKYYGLTFISCMIHEIGHLIGILLSKEGVKAISFNIFGITIFPYSKKISSFFSDICILIAGPFANIVTVFFSIYLSGGSINIFSVINLVLGIFNLLPFSKLDGGCILILLAESCMKDDKRKYFINLICFLNIFFLMILSVLYLKYILSNLSLVIMIFYLFFTEIITMRNLK